MFKRTKVCSGLMLAFGGTLAISTATAFAQQQLDRVEVTGSSIKRIEGEGALPVQILTRDDIQRTGATNVEQLLQSVSAVSSSQGLTAASASGATTGGISAVSLRGLGSIRTLVLLNGRRIAPYGIGFTGDSVSVDVNSIPLAAIERVEILKDGASAVYGSDAIAGVINFILRKEFKGTELAAEIGGATQGGAGFKKASVTFGIGDYDKDGYNLMAMGSVQKEDGLFGRDRQFASSGINEGALNDTTSGNTFPGNIVDPSGTFAGGGSRNPTASTGCLLPYSQLSPLFPQNRCRFDPSPLVTLIPETERVSLFVSGKLALTKDIEGFAEASFNRNTSRTIIQPVPLSDQFALPATHPLANTFPYNITGSPTSTILLTSASPFYPTAFVTANTGGATPDLLVRYRSAVTGNRDITDISEAPRLTFGVRGAALGWDFDAAYLYSGSKVREQVNNGYPSQSAILPILNSGTVNFFGPNSAAVDAQLRATNFTGDAFTVTSSLQSVAAKVSKELTQLPAGALAVATGVEFRQEKLLFDPSPAIQTGDISGYGGNFLTTDRTRDVSAVYGEINLPIVKGLEANAAVRYDKYEGVGSSTNPKVSLRWQPMPSFLMRGSYGTGFRAPSLQDLYLPNTTGVTPPGLNDPLRCIPPLAAGTPGAGGANDCQTQFPVTFGGNAALKAETSKNATIGIVFEPVREVSVGIEYFNIKLDDTINNGVPAATILSDLNAYGGLVTRGPVDPAFPGLPGHIINLNQTNDNFGKSSVSGIDLDLKWSIPTADLGRFIVGLSGTYFIQYETENRDGTFTQNVDEANNATGGVTPRWKHYLSMNWSLGPWSATAAQFYQKGYNDLAGTFEDPSDPAFQLRRVGAYVTYDLQGSYTGFKNLNLTLGVKNVFDRDPPYTNAGGQTSFQAGYDPQYADPRGRFLYARMNYAF